MFEKMTVIAILPISRKEVPDRRRGVVGRDADRRPAWPRDHGACARSFARVANTARSRR